MDRKVLMIIGIAILGVLLSVLTGIPYLVIPLFIPLCITRQRPRGKD
jgi:uncharacterized membrane protein YbaN (DUF454 family)